MKKAISGIMLTLLILSMLSLAFNASFVKAVADPIISGTVRDKLGNPIPNVLIVAQDALTEIDVASATSNATGAYIVTVPPSTYNLIVTPPPESGFGSTTVSNVEVTADIVIDIVLVPAEPVTFGGEVLDRDDNPVPNQYLELYSSAIGSKGVSTDEQGLFSLSVPTGVYSFYMYGGYSAPNVPYSYYLSRYNLNFTEDTFMTITLQTRYLTGNVVDPDGNPVPNVAISARGYSTFGDFNWGSFEARATSDSEGKFNLTVFTCSEVSLVATPPADSPYGAVLVLVNATEDSSVTITLVPPVTFGGEVLDRDDNPVPNQYLELYSSAIGSKGVSTDEQGLFSLSVPTGVYSFYMYGGYSAPNVPYSYYLSRYNLNFTEDTFMTITLQTRYLTGKVDIEGKPVANVAISARGYSTFGDFNWGSFEARATSDSEGKFNLTVFTCSSVSLTATPPPESLLATVNIANIDMTEDKTVLIALFYKAGVLPIANFAWTPETPEVGQTVTFDASTSIPGSGIIIRHKWSFGDGTYAVGKIVTHSYASPGVYTVTLNVTNSKGLWDIEQKQIQVVELPGPKPPVPQFSYSPKNPRVNQEVTFNASASSDPDGQIISYSWNFGDGSTGAGKIVAHPYSKEGNYKVTLTVVDNDGKSSSTSKTLTVLKPKTDERIDDAIAWALDWADGPPYPPGGKEEYRAVKYVNWCLAFVQDAYQFGAGAKIQRYEYAKQAADALGAENNKGIPPRGAFVFYNWYGTIDGEYRNWGHVGLSLGDGQMVHAWTAGPVVAAYDTIGLEYIGWAWPPLTPPIKTSGLSILATCPVDLVVTDPDYLVVSKEYSEIPDAIYLEEDFNGDGSPDDYIFIPERKTGEYLITVIPELGADPTATYTLEASSEGITFLLAENVPISDTPTEPYIIASATFEAPPAPPVVTASTDIDPDTLNLRSKGRWITAYIELPEGYNIADINVSSILLNETIPAELKPIAIGDYDEDGIPDLMVKFDRAKVASHIISHVNMTELIEERFMTVTLTITGKLNDGTAFQGSTTITIILPMPRCGRFIQLI